MERLLLQAAVIHLCFTVQIDIIQIIVGEVGNKRATTDSKHEGPAEASRRSASGLSTTTIATDSTATEMLDFDPVLNTALSPVGISIAETRVVPDISVL